jgi:hypothetical protein
MSSCGNRRSSSSSPRLRSSGSLPVVGDISRRRSSAPEAPSRRSQIGKQTLAVPYPAGPTRKFRACDASLSSTPGGRICSNSSRLCCPSVARGGERWVVVMARVNCGFITATRSSTREAACDCVGIRTIACTMPDHGGDGGGFVSFAEFACFACLMLEVLR